MNWIPYVLLGAVVIYMFKDQFSSFMRKLSGQEYAMGSDIKPGTAMGTGVDFRGQPSLFISTEHMNCAKKSCTQECGFGYTPMDINLCRQCVNKNCIVPSVKKSMYVRLV